MKKEKVLTIKESYELLNKYKTPKIVIKHTEGVAKVSYLIGKKMKEKGISIDLVALISAALLHDIFKIIEITDYSKYQTKKEVEEKEEFWNKLKRKFAGKDHETAFEMEFGKEYPKISKISVRHRHSQINEGFDSWEEKIMYYADKLVKFDKITTLKERLDDGRSRYRHKYPTQKEQEFLDESDKKIFSLEKEIFKTTGLSPNDLIKLNDIKLKELIKDDLGEI